MLRKWSYLSHRRGGIPFVKFQTILAKLQHAFLTIPAGHGLLSPFYVVLAVQPHFIYLHWNKALMQAVCDCRTFLRELVSTPTRCSNLVGGWPDYVGIIEANSFGAGGVIVGESLAVPPTVFRLWCPLEIMADVITDTNPTGNITNLVLEMAGLLLFPVMVSDGRHVLNGSKCACGFIQ